MKKIINVFVFLFCFFCSVLPTFAYSGEVNAPIDSSGERYVSITDGTLVPTEGLVLMDIRDYLMYISLILTCIFVRISLIGLLGKNY